MTGRQSTTSATSARRFWSEPYVSVALLGLTALIAGSFVPTNTTVALAAENSVTVVTGGTITDYQGYRYHAFTHTGGLAGAAKPPPVGNDWDTRYDLTIAGTDVDVDYLIVAGGGGGGRNRGGGGGAGGLLQGSATLSATTGTYEVVVGGGGKGGTKWTMSEEASSGCDGANSSFNGLIAVGGGGGAAFPSSGGKDYLDCEDGEITDPTEIKNGRPGGSGGGGARNGGLGGMGTAGQGTAGGPGGTESAQTNGGGGGAGTPGAALTGGDGLTSSLLTAMGTATSTGDQRGSDRYFAGGGGGFSNGQGGKGGGGNAGQAGTNGTGGGGGGLQSTSAPDGHEGGSGIVIVRYPVPNFTALPQPHATGPANEAQLTLPSISFGASLSAIDVEGADSVEVVDGQLPTGISLAGLTGEEVIFTGTATQAGSFTFTLRAFKDDTTSGPSVVTDVSVTVEVTPIVPGVPTVTDTVARANSAIFTITPPASNGGSEIIRYEAQKDGTGAWIALDPTDSGFSLTGLDPNTSYSVSIRAVNGVGPGNGTDSIAVTTASLPVFVDEDFSGPLPQENWVYGGRSYTPEIAGGALRLTPAERSRAGSAIYLLPQSPSAGLDVRFKFAMFGGNGADGLTFFLIDGEEPNPTIGAFGGSLGYRFSGSTPGLTSALIGVGFDAWGNFGRDDDGCDYTGTGIVGSGDTVKNKLIIRGPGSGFTGYCMLASPKEGAFTGNPSNSSKSARTHDVQIIVDSASVASPKVRVFVDGTKQLNVAQPTELRNAESFLFGFAASTGGSTNNHDIWDLKVGTLAELPPMAFTTGQNLPAAGTGSVYNQPLRVTSGVAPYTFQLAPGSALPAGLSLNANGTISGTPDEPLTDPVSFTVIATDNQTPPDQTSRTFTLTVEADQVIEVGAIGTQDRRQEAIQAVGTSVAAGTDTPTGLPITWDSTTPGVCTVNESGLVSLITRGTCTITANQSGGLGNGFNVTPAPQVTRTFTVTDTALESLTLSTGSLQPSLSNTVTAYQVSVPNSVSSLTLTPVSRFGGAVISVGGAPVASGEESDPVVLAVGQNVVILTIGDGDSLTTITLTISRAAPPAPPATNQTSRPTPPTVTPPAPGSLTIPRPPTTSPVLGSPPPAPVATGPVITGGQPPRPTGQTTATVGGTPTPVSQAPIGSTGVRVTTGTLDIGVRVNSNQQGTVRTTPQGTPELVVVKGQQTVISGSGVAPGSTVQAFLPLGGTNAIELGRIQADATGTFSGDAVLNTPLTQAPLPIGRQVLQILGVDEDGNQTVVNMTINIAQPPPQPEINREDQEVPTLGVGQSLATEAGIPVPVTVTPIPENNQTLISGDGWTMGISVAGEGAEVEETADGDVVLKLVRDETASVSGSGFMPLTRADVWLFSDPTLLGTVDIDENGEFNGVVNVDGNVVTVGEHTLQLQGVGQDGYVRAANLGVVVGENPTLVQEPTAATSLSWLLWVLFFLAVTGIFFLFWWLRKQGLSEANEN